MLRRTRFKPSFSFEGAFDLPWWYGAFLNDSVGHYRCDTAEEKVKDSVVHSVQAHSKFVNSIPQKICLRSPQFVTQLT